MTATYDISLSTDKDWVRYLSGDRGTLTGVGDNITGNSVSDEEIAAILDEELNKYYAAARVVDLIARLSGDVASKTVGNLSISYTSSPGATLAEHAKKLRERGSELLLPKIKRIWNNL